MTGHKEGVITIDLAESDDVRRAQRRAQLDEPNRTILGHFRHEIGHYYWPRPAQRSGDLDGFRALFGTDRLDYEQALREHHDGTPADWSSRHVSAYAAMHPRG